MFADYHMHSEFSNDTQVPMEDMIRRAMELGLDEICFTEHMDYDVGVALCDYEAYFARLEEMRREYGDRIRIRTGIEYGVQRHTAALHKADYDRYAHVFDFVILSCHEIDGKGFWRYEIQRDHTQEEYQRMYYEAIYDVMGLYKDYCVLGHLDGIKRYDPNPPYPDEKILPLVEKILRRAISEGRGIEVNTSSFRYQLPDLTPSRRILELYRDLGGEILTLGSDAHAPSHLADHIPQVRQTLRELGFRRFCTFERMRPIFHDL